MGEKEIKEDANNRQGEADKLKRGGEQRKLGGGG